ncbi:aspartyl-tRNA synthetase [Corallococcus sp. CAG:1435]|nr:aspartyl-tRNA synthetase [Corallococcus sp. CAG:1435]
MKRTYIKDLTEGQCKIKGMVETIRDKKIMFIVIRDVTGAVQVTIEKDKCPEVYAEAKKLTPHSFVSVEGECVFSTYVRNGGKEIYPTALEIMSIADVLPIQADSGQDLRMDYRWIDLRDEKKLFMFKIQTAFEKYAVEFFNKNNFIEIHTPKITALSSEGGSEVFELKDYFGQKACLTQSPQLYKQMSMMAGFDKTFEIGEYFRANPSFTSRHDTEFTGIDVEISYIESHHEVMDVEEALLSYIIKGIKNEFNDEYKKYFGKDVLDMDVKIPRIPLYEVYRILKEEKNYEVPRALKGDLDPDGEKLICQYVKEKYNSDFVFIVDFPAKARAFYSMKHEDNPELTKTYDLLFRGIEITSGAQREHRYEQLKQNIAEQGIDPESMHEYLEFFRYGAPTHGGFGLGLTRTLVRLFELPSVKDVTFLFRGPNRLKP